MNPRDYFQRTTCSCSACKACCRHMPGMLVPGDLERIVAEEVGSDSNDQAIRDFVLEHFQASEGALVVMGAASPAAAGTTRRIRTIVPRHDGTRCVFFDTASELCTIHRYAPYGCAYCDMHMGRTEGDRRSGAGLRAIVEDKGGYRRWWKLLSDSGCKAVPLAQRRAALAEQISDVGAQ